MKMVTFIEIKIKKIMNVTYILFGILGIIVIWFIAAYNGFVRLVNRIKEAWADIDVQLKRRYDLIPNLVETVKGYATHEREAFERVTEARARALGAQTVKEKRSGQSSQRSLEVNFAVAEAYPQLRAVESFVNLQNELADTENKIQAARRFYNGNVRDLNIKTDSFPSNIVAKMFNFQKAEFFELEESEAKEPVKVKF